MYIFHLSVTTNINNWNRNWSLTFESEWPQYDRFSVVGGVEGSLLARAAALATAGVVVVVSADDHPTLQEDVGMSPQELEGPETELSVVLPPIGVYVDRAVLRTATRKQQRRRKIISTSSLN